VTEVPADNDVVALIEVPALIAVPAAIVVPALTPKVALTEFAPTTPVAVMFVVPTVFVAELNVRFELNVVVLAPLWNGIWYCAPPEMLVVVVAAGADTHANADPVQPSTVPVNVGAPMKDVVLDAVWNGS
jgi:hypothetical protein